MHQSGVARMQFIAIQAWGQKSPGRVGDTASARHEVSGWAIKMSETSSPTKTTSHPEGRAGLSQFSLCATESERKSGAIYCPEVPLSPIFLSQIWRLKIDDLNPKKVTLFFH